uniref:Reverse transcriptase/retrotransposon-derived protein RNase H-like domain-containing protein n=1 Tax=Cannabis sativa TaxID=3483 RepID=A0A803PJ26_CANSA
MPFGDNPRNVSFWEPIMAKVSKGLDVWKHTYLSREGRLTFIESVLTSLSIYYVICSRYQGLWLGIRKMLGLSRNNSKTTNFGWNEEADKAFQELKHATCTVPVLAMPSQHFIVETDASGYGLGAVLMQGSEPIAYYSHTLG